MVTQAQKTLAGVALLAMACMPALVQAEAPQTIAAHPSELTFPELDYQVPAADQFRHELPNGMVVFIAEDRMLPTFDMSVMVRTGAAFEADDKAGLASIAGSQMRDGGTESMTPEELDERLDFLAASIRTNVSDTSGGGALSCLSKDFEQVMPIFVEVLRKPRFDEKRLRLAKDRILQNIKRRNDSTDTIEGIEWGYLMNGEDHFSTDYATKASVEAITREDLAAFHKKYFNPANMIVAVSGDFDADEMLKKIEAAFADWPAGEATKLEFPQPDHQPQPGVYVVNKDDVNQGRVSIGHKSIMRGSPDEFPLRVMNAILGGSGFQSRLMAKVRTAEGLAYSVGSGYEQSPWYPGDFRCFFQSKTNACAYAVGLVVDEINRIRDEAVSADDLQGAINYYVESFPQNFPTKMALMRTYAADEYSGRALDYWQHYVDNIRKVTIEDVQRVAKEYLHPDKLVILAVGDAKGLIAGGVEKAPDLTLNKFGEVKQLPLRDPETLKR